MSSSLLSVVDVADAEDGVLGARLGGAAQPLATSPSGVSERRAPSGVMETERQQGPLDAVVVATDRLAVPSQHGVLVAQLIGVGAEDVAGVARTGPRA